MLSRKSRKLISDALTHAVLIITVLLMLLPLLSMVGTAFTPHDTVVYSKSMFPSIGDWSLENLKGVLTKTTYGHSADAFWLFKWDGTEWDILTAADKVDVEGDYRYSASPDLYARYLAQQTPYVFTASTWSENVIFVSGGNRYSQYNYVFEADQTLEKDYLKSDLLWAQSYMQTGSYNVHLAFDHVMACLRITVPGVSSSAVVTVEGMPDIDQREVVVGDYYAERSKVNSKFGYKEKSTCTLEQNGKVLGVAVNSDAKGKALVKPFSEIPATGVYTAHREGDTYYLIVPPCTLSAQARIWIRDGKNRYSYPLKRQVFEQGKLYPVNITAE